MKKKKKPIADPLRDVQERCGETYERIKTVAPWAPQIVRYTTGRFARLDGGYRRHCGPTALTNLILTIDGRYAVVEDAAPAAVFRTVADIGKKRGIYRNADILGHFGGTYDILTRWYLETCLRRFRLTPPVRIRWYPFPTETQFLHALHAGKLLYLQLQHHPIYGNHHLLCYGYTVLRSEDRRREIYLLLADGWSTQVRYLRLKSRGICHFFAIG